MAKIISVHSFRGGTGKSNTTANLASLLAAQRQRVGVVDTDIASPGIHVLFGLDEDALAHSLNDYLHGKCEIKEAAYDVTPHLGVPISGKVFLTPASIKSGEIIQFLKEGYDPGVLNEGFQQLIEDLALDVLLIDTHPGLNEETLLSIAISDVLVILLRPDQQDYQGTGVTVEVARKLEVPDLLLLVNQVPSSLDPERLKARVEQIYDCEVAGVVPHSADLMALASGGIFALRFPEHAITVTLNDVATRLLG